MREQRGGPSESRPSPVRVAFEFFVASETCPSPVTPESRPSPVSSESRLVRVLLFMTRTTPDRRAGGALGAPRVGRPGAPVAGARRPSRASSESYPGRPSRISSGSLLSVTFAPPGPGRPLLAYGLYPSPCLIRVRALSGSYPGPGPIHPRSLARTCERARFPFPSGAPLPEPLHRRAPLPPPACRRGRLSARPRPRR